MKLFYFFFKNSPAALFEEHISLYSKFDSQCSKTIPISYQGVRIYRLGKYSMHDVITETDDDVAYTTQQPVVKPFAYSVDLLLLKLAALRPQER